MRRVGCGMLWAEWATCTALPACAAASASSSAAAAWQGRFGSGARSATQLIAIRYQTSSQAGGASRRSDLRLRLLVRPDVVGDTPGLRHGLRLGLGRALRLEPLLAELQRLLPPRGAGPDHAAVVEVLLVAGQRAQVARGDEADGLVLLHAPPALAGRDHLHHVVLGHRQLDLCDALRREVLRRRSRVSWRVGRAREWRRRTCRTSAQRCSLVRRWMIVLSRNRA